MKKVALTSALLMLLGIIIFLPTAPVSADNDDIALFEKLVAQSPWDITVTIPNLSLGKFQLVFLISNGKFQGTIQGSASLYMRADGPVRFLTVKNNVVEFESATGTTYTLQFDTDGHFVKGETKSTCTTCSKGNVSLSPAKRQE